MGFLGMFDKKLSAKDVRVDSVTVLKNMLYKTDVPQNNLALIRILDNSLSKTVEGIFLALLVLNNYDVYEKKGELYLRDDTIKQLLKDGILEMKSEEQKGFEFLGSGCLVSCVSLVRMIGSAKIEDFKE
jgi:hypothetical protein